LFAFLRSICLNSSLALSVEKKLSGLRFFVIKAEPWWVAVAVVSRTSFQLSLPKAKSTFTACLRTSSTAAHAGLPYPRSKAHRKI
jgi:hypothetical protein